MASPDSETPPTTVVILAGGIGSRFWPASTPARPKQLLPLASDRPLIVETLERALRIVPVERIRILAGSHLREPIGEALPELPDSAYWIEPAARGTGPVLTWAAARMAREDPGAVLISLHSDHAIRPTGAFAGLLAKAASFAARSGTLLTVSIPPTRPETGYGWIERGDALAEEPGFRVRKVAAFHEKPDGATATRYLEAGHQWNSGIFIWGAAHFLEEVARLSPEIGPHLPLLDQDDPTPFFDAVDPISVDEAVLERSDRVATVEATFEWDDVGNWDALARIASRDARGNVIHGGGHPVDARGNVTWSDDGPVVLWGVDDLVVVRASGVTVVAPRSRAPEWKTLLDALPEGVRRAAGRATPHLPSDPNPSEEP